MESSPALTNHPTVAKQSARAKEEEKFRRKATGHQMDFMQKSIGKDTTHLSSMKKATVSDLRNLALPKESTSIRPANRKKRRNHTRNLTSRLSHCNQKTFSRVQLRWMNSRRPSATLPCPRPQWVQLKGTYPVKRWRDPGVPRQLQNLQAKNLQRTLWPLRLSLAHH